VEYGRWLAGLLVLSLALALLPLAVPSARAETIKVVVLQQAKFTNLTSYMYNTGTKVLASVNTTKVAVLDYRLEDKDSTDTYVPAVLLTLSSPSRDLNTNESVHYAWVLTSAAGASAIVAVVDINATASTVTRIQFYKVSPVSGDVAILRTNYNVVVYAGGFKLSIPLAGFTDPKVLLMTDSSVVVTALNYIELRSLTNPPSGYTLVRNGSGEAEFTVSAGGRLSVWFDEEHDVGDVDLFVFDQSHPRYTTVSVGSSWSDLLNAVLQNEVYSARVYADSGPDTGTITATGTVKLIVKLYEGDAAGVSWRVACRLESSPQPPATTAPPPGATPQPQPPQPQPTTTGAVRELWGTVQTALSNQSTLLIIVALLFLLLLVAVLRK